MLSRSLAEALQLPLVHLDQHYWGAGWTPTPADEWARVVDALVAEPRWVMDGNYSGTLARRLARADTVVFLDLPRRWCLARVLWRSLRSARPDLPAGCANHVDLQFLRWIWRYPYEGRCRVLQRLRDAGEQPTVVHVRSPGDARKFDQLVRCFRTAA